jgi:hypothetical protein
MTGSVTGRAVFAAVVLVLTAVGSRAWSADTYRPQPCAGLSVDVTGGLPVERSVACEAAGDALTMLARCDVSLHRLLHIEIVDVVRSPFGTQLFGRFDRATDTVFLSSSADVADFAQNSAYASLSPADFYRSSIVHEVVHGAMYQNQRREPSTRAAQEYPAYALQIASLPTDARETFLRAAAKGSWDDEHFYLNDVILGFDPAYFAANAYRHFVKSRDGCEGLAALLSRDVDFIATLE